MCELEKLEFEKGKQEEKKGEEGKEDEKTNSTATITSNSSIITNNIHKWKHERPNKG